jgi:hypothetical protein
VLRNRLTVAALTATVFAGRAIPETGALLRVADVTTTVDFGAYAPGTSITNQYPGITFEYPTSAGFTGGVPADGVVSSDVGGPPVVVAQGAHGGTNAGELVPGGELATFGTFAALTNLADSVSVYIGDLSGVSVHAELDAYDADRKLLPGGVTAVTTRATAGTLLSYSTGGTADIAYVAVYSTDRSVRTGSSTTCGSVSRPPRRPSWASTPRPRPTRSARAAAGTSPSRWCAWTEPPGQSR